MVAGRGIRTEEGNVHPRWPGAARAAATSPPPPLLLSHFLSVRCFRCADCQTTHALGTAWFRAQTDVHRAANLLLRQALDHKRSAGGDLLWFDPPASVWQPAASAEQPATAGGNIPDAGTFLRGVELEERFGAAVDVRGSHIASELEYRAGAAGSSRGDGGGGGSFAALLISSSDDEDSATETGSLSTQRKDQAADAGQGRATEQDATAEDDEALQLRLMEQAEQVRDALAAMPQGSKAKSKPAKAKRSALLAELERLTRQLDELGALDEESDDDHEHDHGR